MEIKNKSLVENQLKNINEIYKEMNESEKMPFSKKAVGGIRDILVILKDYEDTNLTPTQIREIDNLYAEKCKEAVELRKELENSVKLPCKVRDTIYGILLGEVREYTVRAINIGMRDGENSCVILLGNHRQAITGFELIDFGKTVFLTQEEAEKALGE